MNRHKPFQSTSKLVRKTCDNLYFFIDFTRFQLYFVENFVNRKHVDLDTRITDLLVEAESERTFNLTLSPFKNRTLLFVYINTDNNLNITSMEHDGTLLNEKKSVLKSSTLVRISYFAIQTIENTLFVYTEENHRDQSKTCFMLRIFDDSLNMIKQTKVANQVWYMSTNGDCFYTMSHHKSFSTITAYDLNLEFVSKVGQGDAESPFYLSKSIGSFLMSDEYIVINDKIKGNGDMDMITLVKRRDGMIEKKFKIRYFCVWTIYLEKYILTFNNETNTLFSYNFDGDMLNELKFGNQLPAATFESVLKKELYFYDASKNIFYFF